jgi:hypothetical protein
MGFNPQASAGEITIATFNRRGRFNLHSDFDLGALMTFRPHRTFLLQVLFGVTLAALPLSAQSASPALLPLTDNTAAPYLGVREPPYQGTGGTEAFGQWLNRKALYAIVTQYVFDAPGWPAIFDKYWVDPAWSKWTAEVPGRRAVILLCLDADSASLATGAQGGLNDKATAMAKYLVANKLGDSIICMGLINQQWDNATATDAANFVLCWQQIVKAVRAVPGAEKLQFDWVGMNRKYHFPIESAYPGDEYVDDVGMILYDQCLDKSIYPIPAGATADDMLARRKKAWDQYYYPAAQNGLAAWMGVAQKHKKPFSLPMWCLDSDHYDDGTLSTGGDNTYFIQQMFNFIQDPAHHVAFSCYMDMDYNCSKLSPTTGYKTNDPDSAALFQKLFALPGAAPAK